VPPSGGFESRCVSDASSLSNCIETLASCCSRRSADGNTRFAIPKILFLFDFVSMAISVTAAAADGERVSLPRSEKYTMVARACSVLHFDHTEESQYRINPVIRSILLLLFRDVLLQLDIRNARAGIWRVYAAVVSTGLRGNRVLVGWIL